MSAEAFPLQWPEGWPRTRADCRTSGNHFKQGSRLFGGQVQKVTLERACRKLFDELDRLPAFGVVLSSNVPLRADGMPRSDHARYRIDDPGVALYFTFNNRQMAMACDRFDNPAGRTKTGRRAA